MMVLFLPIDFSSLRFELYMLLAALVLVLVSWVCLFIKSLHSHLNTPIIRNNSKMIENNKLSFTPPFVSVIVPARNEEDNIEKCLLSILGKNLAKSSKLFLYPLSQMAGWVRHGHRSRDI